MSAESFHVGKYEYKPFNGSLWVKVFYHNATFNATFNDASEALSSNEEDKYSIIGEIRNRHRINGKYEFLLNYPEYKDQYNQWKQTNAPHREYYCKDKIYAIGYDEVHIDWRGENWGGLQRSNPNSYYFSYIKGSFNTTHWYYSIGKLPVASSFWAEPKIPGPAAAVKEVYLWMRVRGFNDNFLTCKLSCKRRLHTTPCIMLIIISK